MPTVISSVTLQLPNVVGPAVAQKMIVLRDATTQALSPVMWISGSAAEPRGWRDFDALLTTAVARRLRRDAAGADRERRAPVRAQAPLADGHGRGRAGLRHGGCRTRRGRPAAAAHRRAALGHDGAAAHQSAVIAHEQSHLEAGDPQLFTFALALLVFMPWNLPLWWQLRRLRYAIEVDCDARVLEGGIDPAHYGETLIAVGERQSAYVGAVAAMSESKSFLEERIES